jgi:hypothetical protein
MRRSLRPSGGYGSRGALTTIDQHVLDELIRQLRWVVADPAFGERRELAIEFDTIVSRIGATEDPAAVRALLPFFDDLLDIDPGPLGSITQAIEQFDTRVYVKQLLLGLPDLLGFSPRTAEVLVARIMNSPEHLAVLASKLPALPPPARAALRQVLDELATDPQFAQRSRSLITGGW